MQRMGLLICFYFTVATGFTQQKEELFLIWIDSLSGDFSFTEGWSYAEGVYKNEWNQLSCDGLCASEIYEMIDSTGRIYEDSLQVFYELVDTSHQYHTLYCESNCNEFSGTNFIEVKKFGTDSLHAFTQNNVSTHCSLQIWLVQKKYITVTSTLNSIIKEGNVSYVCVDGFIEIEKTAFDNGFFKSSFHFKLVNESHSDDIIWWTGKTYSPIK
jgi:hypothetical protein